MKNKKKVLIAVLGILGIVLTTVGVTVAWFTYSRTGTKENTITTGSIKFHYAEGSRTIDVDDMMPMTDAQGKAQDDYFEFTITSDTSRTLDIPYYITARRTNTSDANMDSIVKVYLTKVDDNGNETQVLLSKFSGLSGYSNSKINIPASEKTLYNDTVLAGTTGYTQKYRLRMWIDYDANYIVQEEDQPDQYPLENKSYALTVNVYGEGNDIGESGKTARENTNISSMAIGLNEATTLDGKNYSTTIEVVSTDDMPTSVAVETEGTGATVTVTKVDTTGVLIEGSKIQRLSSSVNVQLPDLAVGTNNYIITVTSADKTKTDTYHLTVIVEIKRPESFATDNWQTIVNAVKSGNGDIYAPNTKGIAGQAVRPVELTWANGNKETHYLRVANTTACTNGETSETACGFVVEFADIIANKQMNTTRTNLNGYPATNVMYNYVTDAVYNALPMEIKSSIIDTTVISGHGEIASDKNCDTTLTTRDSNCNFVQINQKIYLLSKKEVFGTSDNDTAASTTRQLDFYSSNNTNADRIKKLSGSQKEWWLRTSRSSSDANYYNVRADGVYDDNSAMTSYGVSPAFRIGAINE